MTNVEEFNRIEDCNKIDPLCINAEIYAELGEELPTDFVLKTSWGDTVVDLTPAIKTAETLTTMYLSPSESPNCLVYEPERGDNVCIHGDELSRIVSMTKLKDVTQETPVLGGDVYMYNGTTNLFEPFDLQEFVDKTEASITALQNRITAVETSISALTTRMAAAEANISALQTTVEDHGNRIAAIEALLVKPAGAPSNVSLAWGNVNDYSDPNVVVSDTGTVATLDKTHGIYTHNLSTNAYGDEIFG